MTYKIEISWYKKIKLLQYINKLKCQPTKKKKVSAPT
jgi:hypothetical protein